MSIAVSASGQESVRAADTYNTASGLLARGLNDLAVEEYEKFLEEYGDHELAPQARYGLGVAQSRLGHHEAVIEALEPLLGDRRFEYVVESSLLTARSMLALNRAEDASRVLRQLVRRHEDHALIGQAAALYVEALYRAEQYEDVAQAYDERESLMNGVPRERAAYFAGLSEYKQGKLREAVGRFGRLESSKSSIGASARLMLAHSLQQLGDLEAARSAYRNAKANAESDQAVEVSIGLVQVLIDLGRLDEAATELSVLPVNGLSDNLIARIDLERGRLAVLQNEHENAARILTRLAGRAPAEILDDARYWLARAQAANGDHNEAALTLARALQDDPESPLRHEMMYQLGLSLGNAGKYTEACQTLRKLAGEVDGKPIASEALLAAASYAQKSGDATLAEQLSNQAAGGLEGEAALDAAYIAAESAYKREDYQSAAHAFTRLLDDLPYDHKYAASVRYRLGMAFHNLGNAEKAADILEPLYADAHVDERYLPGLLTIGDQAFTEQRWKEAAQWLGRYVAFGADKPSWDAAALRLGMAQASAGDRRSAIATYRELLNKMRDSSFAPRAWYEIGLLAISLDEQDQAIEAFEHAAQTGDQKIALSAYQQLGMLAERSGDHALAAKHFEQAARYDEASASSKISQAQALLAAGEDREAVAVLSRFAPQDLDLAQRATVSALLTLGYSMAGDEANVIQSSEAFRTGGGGLDLLDAHLASGVLYKRARALRGSDDARDAERTFKLLIERYPDSTYAANSMLEIAAIAMADNRYEESLEQCDAILHQRDTIVPVLVDQAIYRKGVSARKLGDLETAAEVLSELADRTPMDEVSASAALIAGESYLELGRMSRAEAMFEAATESGIESVMPVALLRLGESRVALQRWAAAEESYTAFLDRYSSDARAYLALFGRAWSLENQGRHDDAIAVYHAVLAQHDGETAARSQFQIGECLYAQKQYEDAVKEFLRVDLVYAYPQWSAGALYEAGRCFEELDRETDAIAQFEQVIDRFGETQWAELASQRLGRYRHNDRQFEQQGG